MLRQAIAATLLGLALLGPAHAGQGCENQTLSAPTVVRALSMAQRTYAALDASGAQVVVLARAGQDLRKYQLHYSHLGFAYRDQDAQGQPVWRVLHKLNQCGTAESAIYQQGLGEFFLDDLWRFEAAWAVPTPAVQSRLLALLRDDSRNLSMHHPAYSLVSYVWGQKYQQSNQWAIETLAAAMDDKVHSRRQAQAWLQLQNYQPSRLSISALTRLGARMGRANVAFDDHPDAQRYADQIDTVTVDSVFSWLERAGLASAPQRIEESH